MSVSVKDPSTGDWTMIAGEPGAFVGATSSAAGEMGLVPTPGTADRDKFLKIRHSPQTCNDLGMR